MPHVIVKFHPGRTEAEKRAMAEAVAEVLRDTMGYDIANVSVSVQEVGKADWMDQVYELDLVRQPQRLVRRPAYGSLAD